LLPHAQRCLICHGDTSKDARRGGAHGVVDEHVVVMGALAPDRQPAVDRDVGEVVIDVRVHPQEQVLDDRRPRRRSHRD
jgi:hypothetical protein